MSAFTEKINSDTPTLVDFYAPWCGPCQSMLPVLEQLKEKMADAVHILKVDVDKNAAAAQQYKIMGVPTFILFRNGQIIWKKTRYFQSATTRRSNPPK